MRGWLRRQLAVTLVVHTTEGQSIRGVLEETARDGVILRAAVFLDTDETALAGETFIPRSRVAFVQVLRES